MDKIINNHKKFWKNRKFFLSFAFGLLLLIISLIVNFYAGIYATEKASNAVTDIILSNIRVFDVDGIFVYGSLIFWIFIFVLGLRYPEKIPFTLKTIALFILIRALFISLTHIGPFPQQIPINSNLLNYFTFGADLFFSGHTGLPFLMALVFWEKFYARIICIASAVIFGIIVLMAHLHYLIDVLSAFFITYTIYRISEIIFKEDRKFQPVIE